SRLSQRARQYLQALGAEWRAVESRGLDGCAEIGRQEGRDEPILSRPLPQLRLEQLAQAVARLEETAGGGYRDADCSGNLQMPTHGVDDVRELPRCALEQPERGSVPVCRCCRDDLRELREPAAIGDILAVDRGTEIEIALQSEVPPYMLIQGPARLAAVAHAREQSESLARQPVRRPFVAEELAPATRAGAAAGVFPVCDRASARYDVDAIAACESARPAADHVIVAAVPPVRQSLQGCRIQSRQQRAVFSVCRQSQKRVAEILCAHLALAQGMRYATPEHVTQSIEPDFQIVGRAFPMRGQHAPRLVDQHKTGLGAAPIDTKKGLHEEVGKGWMDTPWTTRFTVPAAFGMSGDSPSDSDRRSASVCANAT